MRKVFLAFVLVGLALAPDPAFAEDWLRFRGPNGSGVSMDSEKTPVQWSDTRNLKWKRTLPGPGCSSPIVVGNRVFVTAWSGSADGNEGEPLTRHLVCVDRATGNQAWSSAVDAALPEDEYRGMLAEHGYATHTPVSDGENVFVFYGKSGVHAYDIAGKHLWEANVGEELDPRGWGSASSPILYKNLLIVTASIESRAMIALDKKTGKQVWKQQADGFASTWGTPVLVDAGERTELVLGVPQEVWSFHPDTGKLLWYCPTGETDRYCSSLVAQEGIVYGIESGANSGRAFTIRAGGTGDVAKSHLVWSAPHRSSVSTPVVYEGRMYWANFGKVHCVDGQSGELIYQKQLQSNADPVETRRRGLYFARGLDYSSPLVADGKLYHARPSGEIFVIKLGPVFEQLAANRFASSAGEYQASPAISGGELFIRAGRTLYCVARLDVR